LEAIFSTQLTVGVLSHNVPRGACMIVGAEAKITPIAKTSAASSRSELVMLPEGLSSVMISVSMSRGNRSLQTDGGMLSRRENHTPPAPSAAASWYPA
jgi:hypothetical protein